MAIDKQIKILVVEDSTTMRKMEVKILKQLKFVNIIEARDGQDAVDKLDSESDVALIISDWNMPNKNGYELLEWVRADAKFNKLPFIMATAQSEKKQTAKAEAAGVSNFITKPFSPQELDKIITKTLDKKAAAAEPAKVRKRPRKTAAGKVRLNVAHIQITDHLTLGVAKNMLDTGKFESKHIELETHCMPGWNPVQEALENGDVDAAFILAPIAMDLFSADTPIKLTLFAHKNGSIAVRKGQSAIESLKDSFKGKTFYIPHMLSVHHMLTYMLLHEMGLKPGLAGHEGVDTFFEVIPPVKMPEFLGAHEDAGGFTVAEPIGTKAIAGGLGNLLFLSGELWEYHPCCVVVMRENFITDFPDAVQEFTNLLVKAGQEISKRPEKAAEIGVEFLDPERTLGLNVAVLKNVLKEPQGIKTDDLFPVVEDLDRMQRYMVEKMGIGTTIDLNKFVDTRFAQAAYADSNVAQRQSRFHNISASLAMIRERQMTEDKTRAALDKEGKYLIFELNGQDYGISITSVKEIVGMLPIRSIPQAPTFVKGVVNLRDKVIPVIDLRLKFGMQAQDYHDRTCIVVLDLVGPEGHILSGMVVDSVAEVLNIRTQDIEDSPAFGLKTETDFILAMAKLDESVKILLDADLLFKSEAVQLTNVAGMMAN
jgi:chemotaxis signal transduction protein/ABC-type nitrate/sulfonate/bicarbonate transport system substrate-binding protein